MSEYTVRLQSNQNNRTTLLGSVAPRKFGQLIDVNMIGVANGDLVSYDAATQTFVPVSNVSGITTYATASGVSTSVVGGIGSITQLYVSGISTLGIVKISSGIVTATSGVVTYYGDGSKLTGVNSFNVVTQTITNNPVYPTFVTATGVSSVAISTEQFVFIPSSGNLGIGTTNPTTTLHVQGNIGFGAGYNIKLGDSETGKSITSGTDNFFAGIGAGSSTSSGSENIFLGKWSGYCNTLGNENIFLGRGSGYYNTIGYNNIFFGTYAGRYNTEGVDNIFIGNSSGSSNIDGDFNNFFGTNSGYGNTSGIGNNFFGCSSGACNVSGNYNTFFGDQAGCSNTIGSNNVVIGNSRQTPIIDGSNQLAIGAGSTDWIVGNENFNVGIGTTNPQYKLHVGGDVNFSGTLYQNGVAFSAGGGSSQWETVASGISTSSNVGIGTTNPTSKLDVIGDIVVSGNSTLGHIQISSGIITAVSGIVTYYGDGSNLTGVIATNGLVLTDVSADGLTFYAGKAAVGIATTEPFWSIRRTLFSGSGLVTSTGIARDISWINRNTGIYT
jgi:hypothetical protein